eukprot:807540-Prymnesium_polylepis.1
MGATVGEAWVRHYYLDRICRIQVAVGRQAALQPDPKLLAHAAEQCAARRSPHPRRPQPRRSPGRCATRRASAQPVPTGGPSALTVRPTAQVRARLGVHARRSGMEGAPSAGGAARRRGERGQARERILVRRRHGDPCIVHCAEGGALRWVRV